MNNDEVLKEKRAKLFSDFTDQMKKSIKINNIKGEIASKIHIYNRIGEYTYYSEVSIRKFLTGAIQMF